MITAAARTNEIGNSVTGADLLGVRSAKTASFCIDKSGKYAYWHDEYLFRREPLKGLEYPVVLGKLLGDSSKLGLIAHYMQESGIDLRTNVERRVYKPEGKALVQELWAGKFRYKLYRGRVYGHARKRVA